MSLLIEPLPDDRIRAEIGKLMAQTVKLAAEQAKFNAEAVQKRESTWLPIVAIMAGAGVWVALAVLMSRLSGG